MSSIVLHYVLICSNVLDCTWLTVLYCALLCPIVLHCASLCFIVLHCALLCFTVFYCVLLCFTVLYCGPLCFIVKPGLLDNAFNFWLMHLFEYPKMHVTQNVLRAQTCMWQYWKKHFLTGKYPKLEKKHVRQAACQAAGRPGRSAVWSAIFYFIIN